MTIQYAIQIEHLSKCFDSHEVIRDCTVSIQQGVIYGLRGVNGAGKTTLFKLICSLLRLDKGNIKILGNDIRTHRDIILSNIGSMIESPVYYEHLSARENLRLHLAYMNTSGMDIDQALKMSGLSDVSDNHVSTFSTGMRQRLGIARAIIHKPAILILDEPINGLDPMGIRQMRELFITLVKTYNMTIILSSHILSEMMHVADHIGILSEGYIVHEVELQQLKKEYYGNLKDYFFTQMSGGTMK